MSNTTTRWRSSNTCKRCGNVKKPAPTLAVATQSSSETPKAQADYVGDEEGDPNVSHARFEYCGIKASVLTGNVLENVRIEVEDQTGSNKPIVIRNNILENSRIEHSGPLKNTALDPRFRGGDGVGKAPDNRHSREGGNPGCIPDRLFQRVDRQGKRVAEETRD